MQLNIVPPCQRQCRNARFVYMTSLLVTVFIKHTHRTVTPHAELPLLECVGLKITISQPGVMFNITLALIVQCSYSSVLRKSFRNAQSVWTMNQTTVTSRGNSVTSAIFLSCPWLRTYLQCCREKKTRPLPHSAL